MPAPPLSGARRAASHTAPSHCFAGVVPTPAGRRQIGETTMIVEPIHTAVVNGKPLRFFPSPIGNTDP
jgi:hypothetical protein